MFSAHHLQAVADSATATAALLSDTLNRHVPRWDAYAQTRDDWDWGAVFHALPTVSHDRILLKLSLTEAQSGPPSLAVGGRTVTGARTDSRGFFWEFDVTFDRTKPVLGSSNEDFLLKAAG